MFSSKLTGYHYVFHQCTLYMLIIAFNAALSMWLTESILLFSDIFCQYSFPGDLDGVISQYRIFFCIFQYKNSQHE